MKKAYLVIYNDELATREQMRDCIHICPHVLMWRYDLPHTLYFVSEQDAPIIAQYIRQYFHHGKGFFIVVQAGENKEGCLPRASWHMLNQKELLPGG